MAQLEDELHTAARLGKDLLDRHDEYIRQAETERLSFLAEIERQQAFAKLVDELEDNNRALELQNQRSMHENMILLKRLEELHTTLNNVDVQNEQLRCTLNDAELTVSKLSQRAVKADAFERQAKESELERERLVEEVVAASQGNMARDARLRHTSETNRLLHKKLAVSEQSQAPTNSRVYRLLPNQGLAQTRSCHASEEGGPQKITTAHKPSTDHNADLLRVLADSQDEIAALRSLLQEHQESELVQDIEESRTPRRTVSQELHKHQHYHYHMPGKITKAIKRNSKINNGLSRRDKTVNEAHEHAATSSADESSLMDDNLKTPVRAIISNGLCSPPSTDRRGDRDSGYFSFASIASSGIGNHAPSVYKDLRDTWTPIRAHLRSNSMDSLHLQTESLTLDDQDISLAQDRPDRANETAPTKLQHSTSHESVLEIRQPSSSIGENTAKAAELRRPYPAPLQNIASSAAVSMTSVTAYNSPMTSGALNSPRSKSYKALRNAAAAQKLSPSTSGPPLQSTAQFWRRQSDRAASSVPKVAQSPGRWASFVPRWSTASSDANDQKQLSTTSAIVDVKATQDQGGTAVLLSSTEEELLRDALAL